jgi:acylphosphatase
LRVRAAVAERRRVAGTEAIRAVVRGDVQGVGFRDATVRRARELMVMGWVRNGEGGTVQVHAEGDRRAVAELVAFLHEGPLFARVAGVEIEQVAIEGHEQFTIRGGSAGVSSSKSTRR